MELEVSADPTDNKKESQTEMVPQEKPGNGVPNDSEPLTVGLLSKLFKEFKLDMMEQSRAETASFKATVESTLKTVKESHDLISECRDDFAALNTEVELLSRENYLLKERLSASENLKY